MAATLSSAAIHSGDGGSWQRRQAHLDRHAGFSRLSIEAEGTHLLEEVRMVMPGVQALFGFQLIAIFNPSFAAMLVPYKIIHVVCMVLTAAATLMLLAPAAYHRHAEPHWFSRPFVRRAGRAVGTGLFALMASLSLQFVVIAHVVFGDVALGAALAGALFAAFAAAWFVVPCAMRWSPSGEAGLRRQEESEVGGTAQDEGRIGGGSAGRGGAGDGHGDAAVEMRRGEPSTGAHWGGGGTTECAAPSAWTTAAGRSDNKAVAPPGPSVRVQV